MSHFSVLVIGPTTDDALTAALQPFHEFECTGIVDQYVRDVDITEEERASYERDLRRQLKASDGSLHDPYEDCFWRDPTPEEQKKAGSMFGSGYADGVRFRSQDWNDGRGYRAKVHFIPDGFEDVNVPTKEVMTFLEYVQYQHSYPVVSNGVYDNDCKHGWIDVHDGAVVRVIRRTNTDSRWDWWEVGGRYKNKLLTLDGERGDSCAVGQIDFMALQAISCYRTKAEYQKWAACQEGLPEAKTWTEFLNDLGEGYNNEAIDAARKQYRAQPRVVALNKAFPHNFDSPLDLYHGMTLEQALEQAALQGLTTWAIVDARQTPPVWHERGKMGWFAMATDEKEETAWLRFTNDTLNSLSPGTVITIVDCHV